MTGFVGPGEGLRKRAVDWGNGRIRLTLFYDERKEELKVFVHEAAGLPGTVDRKKITSSSS